MDNTILNKFLDSFSEHPEKWSVKGVVASKFLKLVNDKGLSVCVALKNQTFNQNGFIHIINIDLVIIINGKFKHEFEIPVTDGNGTHFLADFVQENINRQYRSDLKEIEGFL